MEVDWSTATVKPASQDGPLVLEVTLRGRRDQAFHEAFQHESRELAHGGVNQPRTVSEWMSGMDEMGISVSPIDPDDVVGERQMLESFIERVNQRATPIRARLDAEHRRRQEEREALADRARDLTQQFRTGG